MAALPRVGKTGLLQIEMLARAQGATQRTLGGFLLASDKSVEAKRLMME